MLVCDCVVGHGGDMVVFLVLGSVVVLGSVRGGVPGVGVLPILVLGSCLLRRERNRDIFFFFLKLFGHDYIFVYMPVISYWGITQVCYS